MRINEEYSIDDDKLFQVKYLDDNHVYALRNYYMDLKRDVKELMIKPLLTLKEMQNEILKK